MLTKNFRKKIRISFCKIQKKLVPYESTRTEAYFNCHTDFVFDQNGQNTLAVLSINAKFYGHFRRSIMAWTASTWSEMKKVSWRVKKRL